MQMLDVAFSRRMCCSRVPRASRRAGLPWASLETPTSRPGIWRLNSSRVARNPAWGPPNPSGTPNRWAEPTATSAPNSPGGRRSVRARRSAATMQKAPAAFAFAKKSAKSWIEPAVSGYWTRTPKQPAPGSYRRWSPTTTSRPRGLARVRTMSMVWGWQRSETKNSRAPRRRRLEPVAHQHRLGRRGAFVEHRGVGDLEPGQVADHRLEVEEGLQPALGDLGLVGRVGRVPARVLEDGPLDDRRA